MLYCFVSVFLATCSCKRFISSIANLFSLYFVSGAATALSIIYTGPSTSCQSQETFTCDNGRCINENDVCDDVDNCGDNSDEERGCRLRMLKYDCGIIL